MRRYSSMRKLAFGGPEIPFRSTEPSMFQRLSTGYGNYLNGSSTPPVVNNGSASAATADLPVSFFVPKRRPVPPIGMIPQSALNRPMTTITAPGGTPPPGTGGSDRFGKIVANAEPFVSNIVNAFRKPPMPKKPLSNPYVTLNRVNLQNERNQVGVSTAAANRASERNLDANTAEAVKQFNRGDEFSKLSSINEREQNTNSQIANQEALVNAQITQGNNSAIDEYNDSLVERRIAQQREQSANWANAGDKLTGMRNEREKGRVELEKARVLSGLFSKSGVLDRYAAELEKMGIDNPLKTKQAYGGFLRMRKLN